MWCQKCNKYYDTDAETCEKCGEKLIDYTPIVEDDREDVLFMSNLSPDEPEEQNRSQDGGGRPSFRRRAQTAYNRYRQRRGRPHYRNA